MSTDGTWEVIAACEGQPEISLRKGPYPAMHKYFVNTQKRLNRGRAWERFPSQDGRKLVNLADCYRIELRRVQ